MNILFYIINAFVSLSIGVYYYFNKTTFSGFVTHSLIMSVLLFGLFFSFAHIVLSITKKSVKKTVLFLLLGFVLIILILFQISFNFAHTCHDVVYPPILVENIFTGTCSVGYFGPCGGSPLWYHTTCSLSTDQKIELFKDEINLWCSQMCDTSYEGMFCRDEVLYFVRGISCNDLFECDSISCE